MTRSIDAYLEQGLLQLDYRHANMFANNIYKTYLRDTPCEVAKYDSDDYQTGARGISPDSSYEFVSRLLLWSWLLTNKLIQDRTKLTNSDESSVSPR